MFKLILVVVVGVVGFVIREMNVAKAKARLKSLEAGELCVHCGSTNVTRVPEGVRCGDCGELTSNALIDLPPVDDSTLSNLMTPETEDAVERESRQERERERARRKAQKEEKRRQKERAIQDQASGWSAEADE